jgi:hypothetical protein
MLMTTREKRPFLSSGQWFRALSAEQGFAFARGFSLSTCSACLSKRQAVAKGLFVPSGPAMERDECSLL